MAYDFTQGDPKLIIGADGSDLMYSNGQPLMEQGIQNQVLIALFTSKGWCGNILFPDVNQQIGSNFEEAHKQPITLKALNDIRSAAISALTPAATFGTVDVIVTNPEVNKILSIITITPPNATSPIQYRIVKYGMNWVVQILQ
jgi:phage gp46-like protein